MSQGFPNKVIYRSCEIESRSRQLVESGKWTLDIEITHHYGSGVKCQQFSAANTYQTKEEAMQHCFYFGKKMIDEGMFTVDTVLTPC